MMELQEAIRHAREVAAGNHPNIDGCSECAKEHAQLADWLDELQVYRQLRERGLLMQLPCKVGDTVYRVWKVEGRKPEITEHKMENIVQIAQWLRLFHKTVFVLRAEAEVYAAKEESKK